MIETSWTLWCRGAESTQALAERLGRAAAPGVAFALQGDLGAGKTTFIQGLARGFGVRELREVVSPTYALMNVYPGTRGPLVHVDFYRLDDPESAHGLGIEEQLARPDALIAVEWAERFTELLPERVVWLTLSHVDAETRRVEARGISLPEPLPDGVLTEPSVVR